MPSLPKPSGLLLMRQHQHFPPPVTEFQKQFLQTTSPLPWGPINFSRNRDPNLTLLRFAGGSSSFLLIVSLIVAGAVNFVNDKKGWMGKELGGSSLTSSFSPYKVTPRDSSTLQHSPNNCCFAKDSLMRSPSWVDDESSSNGWSSNRLLGEDVRKKLPRQDLLHQHFVLLFKADHRRRIVVPIHSSTDSMTQRNTSSIIYPAVLPNLVLKFLFFCCKR